MADDGSVAGDMPGDGIFTARIPAQPHRTSGALSRSLPRICWERPCDCRRLTIREKNFALFVYDGVPNYIGNGQVFGPAALNSLPVYQWITRSSDFAATARLQCARISSRTSSI